MFSNFLFEFKDNTSQILHNKFYAFRIKQANKEGVKCTPNPPGPASFKMPR